MYRDYLVLGVGCEVCEHEFMKNVVREARKVGMKVVICSPDDRRRICRIALRTGVPAVVRRDEEGVRVVASGFSQVLDFIERKRRWMV